MVSFDISDKKVLIIGASSGIGRALVLNCCRLGANVTSLARRRPLLESLSAEVASLEGQYSYEVLDITVESAVSEWIKKIEPFDSVVISSGIIEYGSAKFFTKEKILKVHNINFLAVSSLVSTLVKNKKIKSGGSIVFVGSISSLLGTQGTASYAASKAALEAYARVLATELAPQRIRVNTVLPGTVKTEAVLSNGSLDEESIRQLELRYPLGLGEVEDVVGAIVFLISPSAKWITGSSLILDGGFLLNR